MSRRTSLVRVLPHAHRAGAWSTSRWYRPSPPTVVQRGIDRHVLHLDVGSAAIQTPAYEKRIGALSRGAGPRGTTEKKWDSFEVICCLWQLPKGAHLVRARVSGVTMSDGRPLIEARGGVGSDVRSRGSCSWCESRRPEGLRRIGNRPQVSWHREKCSPRESPRPRHGRFLSWELRAHIPAQIPRLGFAALISKEGYVAMCMIGEDLDEELIKSLLDRPEVRERFPRGYDLSQPWCQCSPLICTRGAVQPFGDRVVLIGDCGVTRPNKDGIGLPTGLPRQRP